MGCPMDRTDKTDKSHGEGFAYHDRPQTRLRRPACDLRTRLVPRYACAAPTPRDASLGLWWPTRRHSRAATSTGPRQTTARSAPITEDER